jgi:methionyl-tRNA synthetase
VQALIERIFERNPDDFYEKAYRGGTASAARRSRATAEIVDGKCPLHPTRELQWTEERNWFFRLSATSRSSSACCASAPTFCRPESRRNEILGLLAQGLEDVSASRSRLDWGVPFPRPTRDGETQATYVWFDALPNYLTATGFPTAAMRRAGRRSCT